MTSSAFLILESWARKKLDLYTQNRLQKLTEIPEDIKTLMFLLVGKLKSHEERDTGGISSVSNDGYAVSYEKGTEAEDALESVMLSSVSMRRRGASAASMGGAADEIPVLE